MTHNTNKERNSRQYFRLDSNLLIRKSNALKSKRSQITIFAIVAIVLVVAMALFFTLGKSEIPQFSKGEDPKVYIRDCSKTVLEDALEKIIPHGGFVEPENSLLFNKTEIVWLCYTPFDKQLCVNKHPALVSEIENEIAKEVQPRLESCFAEIKSELAGNNYREEDLNFEVNIVPEQVMLKIKKKIAYTINEQETSIENFDYQTNSPIYDFARLALEITNAEVSCNCGEESCGPDLLELNEKNREFKISKVMYNSDGEEVYSIQEKLTAKIFNLAIRNCA